MSPVAVEDVLPKLEGVKRHNGWYEARCPAHEDNHASLSVSTGREGRLLLYCHAACELPSILESLDLEWTDLFPSKDALDNLVAEYEYRDVDGRLLFVVERRAGKRFVQRAPNKDGSWAWKLDGVKRVLYRARAVADGIAAKRFIFLVEGEKDVHTLEGLGFVATCNPMGAGKWRPEYTRQLHGAKVVILPDNDEAGFLHANRVMGELAGKTTSLQRIELPGLPDKGDATDWVRAGGTAAELKRLVLASAQAPDLTRLCRRAKSYTPQGVEFLWWPRIPMGCVTVLAGHQGCSKSYLTLALVADLSVGRALQDGGCSPDRILQAGPPTASLLITYEDSIEQTIVPRLMGLGADLDLIHLVDQRREDGSRKSFRDCDIPLLDPLLEETPEIGLLVIDPASGLQVEGAQRGDENSESAVRRLLEPLDALARRRDIAILLVKHLNKDPHGSALARVGGSSAWTQVPRSVLLAGQDPKDQWRKGVAHVKANLTHRANVLGYEVDERGLTWTGPSQLGIRDLLKAD